MNAPHLPHLQSGGRYPVLRSLAILYLLAGALAAIGGVVAAVWALAAGYGAWMDRLIIAGGVLVAAFFVTITALAVEELLKLFIDIEHNTRMAGARMPEPTAASTDGPKAGGRLAELESETAESALIRGH